MYSTSYYSPSAYSGRSSRFDNCVTILIVLAVALVAVLLGVMTYNAIAVSGSAKGCTVVNKTETRGSKGHMHREIFAEGCSGSTEHRTFSVDENWFAGQLDPKETYTKLEIGKTYDFETRGSKIELINALENIVSFTEVVK